MPGISMGYTHLVYMSGIYHVSNKWVTVCSVPVTLLDRHVIHLEGCVIWYHIWYHEFLILHMISYDWKDLWYHRHMISYAYDSMKTFMISCQGHVWYQELVISYATDIIGKIIWNLQWYHTWYHSPESMISCSWIYDIKNSWYHMQMIS